MAPRRRATIFWALVVLFVLNIAVGINSIVYTRSETRKAEQRAEQTARQDQHHWCAILNAIDEAYTQDPPNDALGRSLKEDVRELRAQLSC